MLKELKLDDKVLYERTTKENRKEEKAKEGR
jgi:hypothetical protein